MFKTKINLITASDIHRFVDIVSQIEGSIKLVDGNNYVINAKSIMGCIAAMEWNEMYVVSDTDIYTKIMEFAE